MVLGTSLNINNEEDQTNAAKANNIILVVNMLIVVVNLVINVFEMKDPSEYLGGGGSTTEMVKTFT